MVKSNIQEVNIITPPVAENKIDCDLVELTKLLTHSIFKGEVF